MNKFPVNLQEKLNSRLTDDSFRSLVVNVQGVDFYSNDYLGFSKNENIAKNVRTYLEKSKISNGSSGSRLISGTHPLHLEVEKQLASLYNVESGLLYNSGYDANLGLFSAILQKDDVLLFDELIHASVRDGVRLSNAKTYKFKHNNLKDLEKKIIKFKEVHYRVYVAIEAVYSMDGDMAPLKEIVELCLKYDVYLIVDEAHSSGVFGEFGEGLVCNLGLESCVFARVHTFGKAMGCHGAIVLGSDQLRDYLINFSRSFIYTTAIPIHAVATIKYSYLELSNGIALNGLKSRIDFFNLKTKEFGLSTFFIKSTSAIHCCLIKGNNNIKNIESFLLSKNIIVKAVLYPTVPKGKERLRICIHNFNNEKQIVELLRILKVELLNTAIGVL